MAHDVISKRYVYTAHYLLQGLNIFDHIPVQVSLPAFFAQAYHLQAIDDCLQKT